MPAWFQGKLMRLRRSYKDPRDFGTYVKLDTWKAALEAAGLHMVSILRYSQQLCILPHPRGPSRRVIPANMLSDKVWHALTPDKPRQISTLVLQVMRVHAGKLGTSRR